MGIFVFHSLPGIFYSVCMIAVIIAVVSLEIVSFNLALLSAVMKGIWSTIKEVTGFVWSAFVAAVKNPDVWKCLAVIGAGATVANPLVGGLICGVGLIGSAATS